MRRQAATLLLLQGLVKHGWVAAFRVAPPRHAGEGTTLLRKTGHSSTRSTVRSRSCTTSREAAATTALASSGEQVFAEGGAEKIAELLAGESAGEGAVFYNRVGAINRDLSVLMATVLAEERLKESLAGKKRKRRKAPLPSQPSLDDGIAQGEATTRRRSRWGVRSFFRGALGRSSKGRRGGGNAKVSTEEHPRDTRTPKADEDDDGLVILDAFAASGVRALRYLTEVPRVRQVVANDYDAAAIDLIRQAADLCGAGDKLDVHRGDAIDAMYAARAGGVGTYDLIDIDPFGCAAGFLDAGVQAVTDGGLLCVTSTDMPVLSGVQPEVAWTRYGSVPTRSGYHHEMSLRILLHSISAAAGRYRRSIEPVLSIAIDHYVRVFVRVSRSPKAALAAGQQRTSYVLQSEDCSSFFLLPVLPPKPSTEKGAKSRARRRRRRRPDSVDSLTPAPEGNPQQPNEGGKGEGEASPKMLPLGLGGVCPETGGQMNAGGPIWSGPLHDEAWVARAIAIAAAERSPLGGGGDDDDDQSAVGQEPGLPAQRKAGGVVPRPRLAAGARVESLLTAVSQELPDVPLFYNLRDMFATLGLKNHPRRDQVMGALEAVGYRTSGMHKEPLALKTDAPDAAVWDVLRCWARNNPQPAPVRAAGLAILGRGTQLIAGADFEAGVEARTGGGKGGFLHAHNPEQDWGPLARRSVMARGEDEGGGEEEEEESAESPAMLSSQ